MPTSNILLLYTMSLHDKWLRNKFVSEYLLVYVFFILLLFFFFNSTVTLFQLNFLLFLILCLLFYSFYLYMLFFIFYLVPFYFLYLFHLFFVWFFLSSYIVLKRYVIESPRWLISKKRFGDAIRQFKKIAKINGRQFDMTEKELADIYSQTKQEVTYGIASLFSGWRLAKNTSIMGFSW